MCPTLECCVMSAPPSLNAIPKFLPMTDSTPSSKISGPSVPPVSLESLEQLCAAPPAMVLLGVLSALDLRGSHARKLVAEVHKFAHTPRAPSDLSQDIARVLDAPDALSRLHWDAALGRTAISFVDRAGDPHPGIDSAEEICADFYKAMGSVVAALVQERQNTAELTY